MGATRRMSWLFALGGLIALAVVAALGVNSARAQQDDAEDDTTLEDPDEVGSDEVDGGEQLDEDGELEDAPAPTGPQDDIALGLVERLDELELDLPVSVYPTGVTISETETWGELQGDAGSTQVVLDTLEPDLRQLFVDADDAQGEVADAVAQVARGWLDIWQGTTALAEWETADLAFPVDATDADDVATGADERYGEAERGLTIVLEGQQRLLDGYTTLRDLQAAEPDVAAQDRFDGRAADMELYDAEIRPLVVAMISQPTTNVLVATERFETSAPGVEARAKSLEAICVDREALEENGGVLTEENAALVLEQTRERVDCPDLPTENTVTEDVP